jgi:hypothetical protein
MDKPRRSAKNTTPYVRKKVRQLSHGESAAISDLTHRTGMLHVDRQTSTVRVQHEDGHATYTSKPDNY